MLLCILRINVKILQKQKQDEKSDDLKENCLDKNEQVARELVLQTHQLEESEVLLLVH